MKMRHTISQLVLAMGLFAWVSFAHAAVLGLTPNEPLIDYPADGIITYDAVTGLMTISGRPNFLSQLQVVPFLYSEVLGTSADDAKQITVKFYVDAAGDFLQGDVGSDLVVTGSVDVDYDGIADYDGILLEGELTQFGFQDGGAGADQFDLRFSVTGGALNTAGTTSGLVDMPALYSIDDLALTVTSEVSAEFLTPFTGSFATSFTGPAKGNLGSTAPMPPASCQIDVEAYCSVNGNPQSDKCRIKLGKSAKHWEHELHDFHGHSYRKTKYGLHGQPVPAWANRYPTADVKFNYVVTNSGTTPIINLLVDDSFDTPVTSVPAALAPGQSVTLTRSEKLNEILENVVTAMGESGTAMCSDKDTVIIREKLRDRREYDDDKYKDKGKRGDN